MAGRFFRLSRTSNAGYTCEQMKFFVEHIAIPAADPAALKSWYEHVLGARLLWDNGQQPPTCLLELPGGMWLEIYAAEALLAERGNNKLAGFRHMALRVESLASARAELETRGVVFTESAKPAMGGGTILLFADLEGNLLHLTERPAGFSLGKNKVAGMYGRRRV
jgi:catechol 2,3-dioxygenase-like lactoylglutathione lyase family enzyme